MPKTQQPLPAFLFKTPEYRLFHDQLSLAASLDSLPPLLRWQTHKDIMREAATQARDALLLKTTLSPPVAAMLFSTMSRLVWYNKLALTYKLLQKSTIVASHIHVINGKVAIIDHELFTAAFSDAKLALASSNIYDLQQQQHVDTKGGQQQQQASTRAPTKATDKKITSLRDIPTRA